MWHEDDCERLILAALFTGSFGSVALMVARGCIAMCKQGVKISAEDQSSPFGEIH
jgi:hypothetical protein